MNQTELAALTVLTADTGFIACASIGSRQAGLQSGLLSANALVILTVGMLLQLVVASTSAGATVTLATVLPLAAVTVCAATDAATGYVLDAVTLPALAGTLILASSQHQLSVAALGAFTAGGVLALLYAVTLGRGLGLGDVKLACCIGAALGGRDALLSLGVAFILGGAYAAFLLLTRRGSRRDTVAFAPYLGAGMAAISIYRVW